MIPAATARRTIIHRSDLFDGDDERGFELIMFNRGERLARFVGEVARRFCVAFTGLEQRLRTS